VARRLRGGGPVRGRLWVDVSDRGRPVEYLDYEHDRAQARDPLGKDRKWW